MNRSAPRQMCDLCPPTINIPVWWLSDLVRHGSFSVLCLAPPTPPPRTPLLALPSSRHPHFCVGHALLASPDMALSDSLSGAYTDWMISEATRPIPLPDVRCRSDGLHCNLRPRLRTVHFPSVRIRVHPPRSLNFVYFILFRIIKISLFRRACIVGSPIWYSIPHVDVIVRDLQTE